MSYTDFDFPHTHMYDSDLRELLRYVETLWKRVNVLDTWKDTHEAEYKELKDLYDAIMTGNFPESMIKSLKEWTIKNTVDIIGAAINMVFFELTDDGYFVAYIPDGWEEIIFGTTGLDTFPVGYDYGHLTLTY